jgi:hypothetical protein
LAACLSIAVLHHISTVARRLLVAEAMRVVRAGGKGLFCAWAREQRGGDPARPHGHKFGAADVLVPWTAEGRRDRFAGNEAQAEAKAEAYARAAQRYCHVFDNGEVAGLVQVINDRATSGPWLEVEEDFYDEGHWCVVVVKTADPSP